ncbi:uncharacterized protein LOC122252993 isoform X1 [Penaeus japonicus]|uniref:uncharacterized protein LOC122252993 isoform X1 n=1 Tax=Penaeus japonicus TaxID=27405 RepID=UPI001C7150F8|nr:uncharacterized protein LOC122252993 isoform X1 [Penaeus japonicus]
MTTSREGGAPFVSCAPKSQKEDSPAVFAQRNISELKHGDEGEVGESSKRQRTKSDWPAGTHVTRDDRTSPSARNLSARERFFKNLEDNKVLKNGDRSTSTIREIPINIIEPCDIVIEEDENELNEESEEAEKSGAADPSNTSNNNHQELPDNAKESTKESSITEEVDESTTKETRVQTPDNQLQEDPELENGNETQPLLQGERTPTEPMTKSRASADSVTSQESQQFEIDNLNNGRIITNGWPGINRYTVEKLEDGTGLDNKPVVKLSPPKSIFLEECPGIHKLTGDVDPEANTETLVSEKKESKVSKFVRIFNKKETSTESGGERERSVVRKHPSRVWGMCLQVQSPTTEEEDDSSYKKSEKDSVKSEPLLDSGYSDKESSVGMGIEGDRNSTSFHDVEAASFHSLDILNGEKKEDAEERDKLENLNLIRRSGGRRSFDKPEKPTKPKRSNTLGDPADSKAILYKTTKTLPATHGLNELVHEHASHPFYKKFYSHCVILPMRKKKKETTKKSFEAEAVSLVASAKEEEESSGDVKKPEEEGGGGGEEEKPKEEEKKEVESPQKLPVIDDLLAEILENVSLMEKDMKDDEEKRLSLIDFLDGRSEFDFDGSDSQSGTESAEKTPTDASAAAAAAVGEEEVAEGAVGPSQFTRDMSIPTCLISSDTTEEMFTADSTTPDFEWIDDNTQSLSPVSSGAESIKRSNSRVSSLISRFERGSS